MRKVAHPLPAHPNGSFSHYVYRLSADKGLSPTDIERRAEGRVSYSLIASIAAGDYENVRWETLCALARGLGVAAERLFTVAIGAASEEFRESDFLIMYDKYKDLSGDNRVAADSLLRLLHREIEHLVRRQNDKRERQPSFETAPSNATQSFRKSENLPQYVARVLKEKQLTLQEVAQRSRQKISKAYLCNLLHNHSSNPSVEKIKALASGLGIQPQEIFAVLEIQSIDANRSFHGSIFAALYYKYKRLSDDSKKELALLLSIVDREIDKRQMQQLRDAARG